MADYEHLLVKHEGDIVRITMNRPERRNALSEAHLHELLDAFEAAGRSQATGIVLGAEGKAFSAGHDFADVAARDLAGVRDLLRLCTSVMRMIQDVPQVVIARVQAIATAAGAASWWRRAISRWQPSRLVSRYPGARAAGSATPRPSRWPATSGASG